MKFLAMIQARCGSTRFPNKVLKDLFEKTILQRVIERVERANTVDETEDFEVVYTIYNHFLNEIGMEDFGYKDILEYVRKNPEISDVNKNIIETKAWKNPSGIIKSYEQRRIEN